MLCITIPRSLSCIVFIFLFVPARTRWHNHTKHEHTHHHHHKTPTIPLPPPSPSLAEPPSDCNHSTNVYNVRLFGAVGDGGADDTEAFKMAWDEACSSRVESPVLYVPSGYSFMVQSTIFTGPWEGGIVFQVNGKILPPDGPESWPKGLSRRQWLVFYRVNSMSLRGDGLIDGKGEKWWDLPCKPHKGGNGTTLFGPCDSPIAIRFFMSSNLTLQVLKIRNSPQFHFRFDNCINVHIDSVVISAPPLSPNTNGIHIGNTIGVEIYNSVISNGNDCVSIGSDCYNIYIQNITCGPSHGISIGSLGNRNSQACVYDITVRDSATKSSDDGVRIQTRQGGSGVVSGVTFDNIHMDNVRNPIIIDQFYCLAKQCTNQTSAVLVSDVLYTNTKGTYDVRSPLIRFACSDLVPYTSIARLDIELLPEQGNFMLNPFCWNAYGDTETLTIPPVSCLLEGTPPGILENELGSF